MKERRVLGQSLCKVLGQSMVQTLDRDMVWGLGTGSRCGPAPGRYDGLDIGWDWVQALDMSEDPDTSWGWGWVLVRGRGESRGPGCS